MRLDLGSSVHCTDAAFGELADVIVDPLSRRVTHLVVEPHGDHRRARVVPIDRARPAGDGLALDYSIADVESLEPLSESAYMRAGELVVADPDWDIGIQDVLALPVYQELNGMGTAIDPDPHVMVSYDRIPKHEVEVRRSSAVMSTDGHHLGHVEGFLVGSGETADIVLERGHLWGRREIVIPAAAVERVQNDSITLSLTKEQVGELDARHVHRWFRA
jgi:sporulation protein YlmC with PRC-barrel domain